MPFLTRWRDVIVAFLVIAALSVCSYLSYSAASAHVDQVAQKRANEVIEKYKQGYAKTTERESALTEVLAARDQEISNLRQEIKRYGSVTYKTAANVRPHVQPQGTTSASASSTGVDRGDASPVLSTGTVGLLNFARAGGHGDAPAYSDEEGRSPSDVGIEEFIDNDLQVVGRYHELATRHNELVDYVNRACLNITTERAE